MPDTLDLIRIEDLIPEYLARRDQDILDLTAALECGDLEALGAIGHGIKGSGTLFGFPEITEIGRNIERSVRDRDVAGISLQISNLQEYMLNLGVS